MAVNALACSEPKVAQISFGLNSKWHCQLFPYCDRYCN